MILVLRFEFLGNCDIPLTSRCKISLDPAYAIIPAVLACSFTLTINQSVCEMRIMRIQHMLLFSPNLFLRQSCALILALVI